MAIILFSFWGFSADLTELINELYSCWQHKEMQSFVYTILSFFNDLKVTHLNEMIIAPLFLKDAKHILEKWNLSKEKTSRAHYF